MSGFKNFDYAVPYGAVFFLLLVKFIELLGSVNLYCLSNLEKTWASIFSNIFSVPSFPLMTPMTCILGSWKLLHCSLMLCFLEFFETRKMVLNLSKLYLLSGHMVFNSDQMKNCLYIIKLALLIEYNWTISYLGFLPSN